MKRAISPVIATVIIVSVAIAIAVAVAFWMTGITGLFTRYEKLEIISAYAEKTDTNTFTVYLKVRNTGTTDVTIDSIFVDGVLYTMTNIYVSKGDTENITVNLSGSEYISGRIVEVKIHTAAGNEYPKSVQLP